MTAFGLLIGLLIWSEGMSVRWHNLVLRRAAIVDTSHKISPTKNIAGVDQQSNNDGNNPIAIYLPIVLSALTLAAICYQAWTARRQTFILRRQAETLPQLERAYILPATPDLSKFLKMGPLDLYVGVEGINLFLPGIDIRFANFGKTPGIVKAVRAEIETGNLPEIPAFNYSEELTGDIVTRSGDQTQPIAINFGPNLTHAECLEIRGGKRKIHVFGYMKYFDIFEQTCTEGFCFVCQVINGETVSRLAGGERYNYRRIVPSNHLRRA